jgi:hypothetical protein
MAKDISIEGLEELMRHALIEDGAGPDFVEGYVAAQRRSGWLRPGCPAWIRNSAGVYYALPPHGAFRVHPSVSPVNPPSTH